MYQYIRISEETYPKLTVLYLKSFGADIPPEETNRKYDTGNFSLKNIGFLALTEAGEPAAYYGAFPLILQYQGVDYVVAQSGDTMTSPDHRNKGLFVTLAEMTYLFAGQEGIQLIFGFPNQNSFPGFQRKLHWVFNGAMQKFTIANLTVPFSEAAAKWKFLTPMYNKFAKNKLTGLKIELNETNIKSFSENTAPGYIKRDIHYFRYKLADPDNYLIKINDFILLVKPKVHLMIGLVGYFEEDRIESFLATVKKLGVKLACRKTIFIASQNHWLTGYLNKKIQPEESLPIGFYLLNENFDVKNIEFVLADYDTF